MAVYKFIGKTPVLMKGILLKYGDKVEIPDNTKVNIKHFKKIEKKTVKKKTGKKMPKNKEE